MQGVMRASQLPTLAALVAFVGDHTAVLLSCPESEKLRTVAGGNATVVVMPTNEGCACIEPSWNGSSKILSAEGVAEVVPLQPLLDRLKQFALGYAYDRVRLTLWVSAETERFNIKLTCF
jgi:hypothetical protein